MKNIFSALFVGVLIFSFSSCSADNINKNQSLNESQITEETSETTEISDFHSDISEVTETTETEDTEQNNILVAYFSLAGEQYSVGEVDEGNTSIIAHMIAEETDADLFEIEPVEAYPDTYDELLEISREEMENNARPEISGYIENMADYDTIFIGYPIWWGDMPMIVYNFFESYDFKEKTVIPFCTHGGSGLAGTQSTIADITGSSVSDGLAISGATAQNDRENAKNSVTEWLSNIMN
ncbi:MAG: NAD(P)H-dependent oxidoreductase [Ruminococcus sp.]|nr:NAD(P)H-dependent oxidoreductase [Ruminococcus sp.]